MITGCLVRNIRCMPAITAKPISANSGPRWSMVGMSMARSTRSGTLVGPGICRKCLPLCTVMGVLPGLALASRAARIPLFGGLVPRLVGAANALAAGLALPSRKAEGKTAQGHLARPIHDGKRGRKAEFG